MRLEPIEKPKGLLMRITYWMTRRQLGKVITPMKVMYPRMPSVGFSRARWFSGVPSRRGSWVSLGLAESVAGSGVTENAFVPGPMHTEESFMARHPSPGKTFKQIERDFFEGPLSTSL